VFRKIDQHIHYVPPVSQEAGGSRSSAFTHARLGEAPVPAREFLAGLAEGQHACLVQDAGEFEIKACDGHFEGQVFHARLTDKGCTVPMHPVQYLGHSDGPGSPQAHYLFAGLDVQRCSESANGDSVLFLSGRKGDGGNFIPGSSPRHRGTVWHRATDTADHLEVFRQQSLPPSETGKARLKAQEVLFDMAGYKGYLMQHQRAERLAWLASRGVEDTRGKRAQRRAGPLRRHAALPARPAVARNPPRHASRRAAGGSAAIVG